MGHKQVEKLKNEVILCQAKDVPFLYTAILSTVTIFFIV